MRILQFRSISSVQTRGPISLQCLILLSGLLLVLVLCGCASRSKSKWKKEEFALATPAAGEAGSTAHTNVLSLHRVAVAPLFEGQPFVYRTGENSYERDPYAEFFVTPIRMFEQCLRVYLRNGHAFADVLEPGSNLKSSCSMEISVNQLYGDYQQPDHPFAVLQMRFLLHSTEPGNRGRVLWQREFSKRVPIARRTPAALVEGWNMGLREIMGEVNAELRRVAIYEGKPAKAGGGD